MIRDVALILLYDEHQRVLLQQRSDDAPVYPDYWGFFGGKIEEGETPERAVRRECLEELHYQLNNPQLILESNYQDQITGRFGKRFYFAERYDSIKNLQLQEGKNLGWFTLKEAATLKMTEFNLEILLQLEERVDALTKATSASR